MKGACEENEKMEEEQEMFGWWTKCTNEKKKGMFFFFLKEQAIHCLIDFDSFCQASHWIRFPFYLSIPQEAFIDGGSHVIDWR